MSNHASIYCKTLDQVDPAKAINAIHAAYIQLNAIGERVEVDGTTFDNQKALHALCAVLIDAGHIGFDAPAKRETAVGDYRLRGFRY